MTNPEMLWEIPEPLSTRQARMEDGTTITLRRHGNPAGPRLIMSHGNGLAIDLYYPFWSLLADDYDLIVYDLRNHGWNEVTSLDSHTIPTLVSDHDHIIREIRRHYGIKSQVGVYHSLSALVSLLSHTKGADFSGLVLFDPPICKPGYSYQEFDASASQAAGSHTPSPRPRPDNGRTVPCAPLFTALSTGCSGRLRAGIEDDPAEIEG